MFNPNLYFQKLALYLDSGFAKTGSKKFYDSAFSMQIDRNVRKKW